MAKANYPQHNKVITYVPDQSDQEQPEAEMGKLHHAIWLYTNKLGLNFTLVLVLAFLYQVFVAIFIATRGIRSLPIFAKLPPDLPYQVFGLVGALFIGFIIQGLIIAEMAQVVWLRRPDWLKVRLMSDSIWWWVMLVALIISIAVDFFLLFLSVTDTNNFNSAWQAIFIEDQQITIATTLLLAVLNLLTLLRCASVMRTSTSKEIRREVEERMLAIAEEILIDAGDAARNKAQKIYKSLEIDPKKLVPLQQSVLNLISRQHPDLVPPQLGGENWAYDFSSNTMAVLPPEVHRALLKRSQHASQPGGQGFMDEDQNHLWTLPPEDMAKMVGFNMRSAGVPSFADASDPDEPVFLTRPAQFQTLGLRSGQAVNRAVGSRQRQALPGSQPPPPATFLGAGSADSDEGTDPTLTFLSTLAPTEIALYGAYLAHTVFPKVHGAPFLPLPNITIFQIFDPVELQWYYREWKQQKAQGQFQ